jgi:hypothetical protein
MAATKTSEPLDMKLEVVVIGVSDVDRAKAFTRNSAGGSTLTSRKAMNSALFNSRRITRKPRLFLAKELRRPSLVR